MRVLLVNQFFWPDSAPTGVLLEHVAKGLVDRGHRVTVICGSATYAQASSPLSTDVEIVRISTARYSRKPAARILSWGVFLAGATIRSITLGRFDLVVTLTSPPGLSFVGVLLKMFRRSRFWIWEMDVYPDVAACAGVLKPTAAIYRLFRWVMDWPRRRADGIVVLGECMRALLLGHGLDAGRLRVAENWVDGSDIQAEPFSPTPPVVILYSGNLGLAHDIDTIEGVLERLDSDPQVRLLFAGGGARRLSLQQFCRERAFSNVEFPEYLSQEKFRAAVANCHIGLVTLRKECLGTVVPSKVYALLASGRPILFVGPEAATPARIIRKHACGWQFECGDADGVLSLLKRLISNPDLIHEAGEKARATFERLYARSAGVARIVSLLEGSLPDT